MSLFGLGRNQKTFRPKKSAPSGSKVRILTSQEPNSTVFLVPARATGSGLQHFSILA
uniref:Uncharacterized protein n=1 Tax=Triticum urartu TaxID=4572 RepID=A0A8R7PRC1_TRIUA